MKIFWLTPGQVASAIVIGLVIAVFVTFLTAPQPVVVPVQVITPVPTPPPVVITEHPTPQPTARPAPVSACPTDGGIGWLPLVILGGVVLMGLFLFGYSGSSSFIMAIIMMAIGLIVLIMMLPVMNAILCAMPVLS